MGQSHRKSFSLSIQSPPLSHFTSLHPHFFTLWGSCSESWSFEIERSRRFSRKSSFSVSNSRMQPLKPTATPVLWNLGKNIITLTCVISCINYLFQSQKLSYHYYGLLQKIYFFKGAMSQNLTKVQHWELGTAAGQYLSVRRWPQSGRSGMIDYRNWRKTEGIEITEDWGYRLCPGNG